MFLLFVLVFEHFPVPFLFSSTNLLFYPLTAKLQLVCVLFVLFEWLPAEMAGFVVLTAYEEITGDTSWSSGHLCHGTLTTWQVRLLIIIIINNNNNEINVYSTSVSVKNTVALTSCCCDVCNKSTPFLCNFKCGVADDTIR